MTFMVTKVALYRKKYYDQNNDAVFGFDVNNNWSTHLSLPGCRRWVSVLPEAKGEHLLLFYFKILYLVV